MINENEKPSDSTKKTLTALEQKRKHELHELNETIPLCQALQLGDFVEANNIARKHFKTINFMTLYSPEELRKPYFENNNILIQEAARHGCTGELLIALSDKGQLVNIQNDRGNTSLHLAALGGHMQTVQELIQLRTNFATRNKEKNIALYLAIFVAIQNKEGNTALHLAALAGHGRTVLELINLGADVTIQNKEGNTALHLAALAGHGKTGLELISLGTDVTIQNKEGNTALHLAALAGHEETVSMLIQLGANVAIQNEQRNTALHLATLAKHEETVKKLINSGANIAQLNSNMENAFDIAMRIQSEKLVFLIIRLSPDLKKEPTVVIPQSADNTLSQPQTVPKNFWTTSKEFVSQKVSKVSKKIKLKDKKSENSTIASTPSSPESKEKLKPIETPDPSSIIASTPSLPESKENPKPIEIPDPQKIYLRAARIFDFWIVARLLFREKINIGAVDKDGLAAMHLAAQIGCTYLLPHLTKEIINKGTISEIYNPQTKKLEKKEDNTALHCAAQFGRTEAVEVLLILGADPKITNLNKLTPLDVCFIHGHLSTAKAFLPKENSAQDAAFLNKNISKNIIHLMAREAVKAYTPLHPDKKYNYFNSREERNKGIFSCLHWLLNEKKLKLNTVDANNNTWLHSAILEAENFELVKPFIEKIISEFNGESYLSVKNKEGLTPIALAKKCFIPSTKNDTLLKLTEEDTEIAAEVEKSRKEYQKNLAQLAVDQEKKIDIFFCELKEYNEGKTFSVS